MRGELCLSALAHPGVGERGVAVLRVELQGDVSDVRGDPGHHGLHRLVPGDAHVLERSRQKNYPVCNREGQSLINRVASLESIGWSVLPINRLQWFQATRQKDKDNTVNIQSTVYLPTSQTAEWLLVLCQEGDLNACQQPVRERSYWMEK